VPDYTDSTLAAPSVTGQNATAAADAPKKYERKKPTKPDDFEDEAAFLDHVRTTYSKDLEADENNRKEATLDARFMANDQWDQAVRQRREAASKPCLTINRLPAYVAQLVGNRRLSDVGIKVIPDVGGAKKTAEIREGLIRNIQKTSRAQYVFDKAFEQQVIGGLGQFQVHLDYAHDDYFEQDIRIAAIPNPLSVVWDQDCVDPTGADAQHVFVVDRLKRDDFKKRYPDAEPGDFNSELNLSHSGGWNTEDTVQVVSFWRMRSRKRLVGLMVDGTVKDLTDQPPDLWWDLVVQREGEPMVREVQRKYAQMYLCSAQHILAGPYELPIRRVPVFRVPAWELLIEGDRIRWGMIRLARDPQKLHNFWRSTVAEKMVGSPKAKWVAADSAVQGREDAWRKSHLSEDPLLVYNAESGEKPQRVDPIQMEAALMQEAGMAAQDIRDVLNMHESSMGMQSNEVSGRAITARQRVGELGSVIYQDNLNMAIEEAGMVINELIPFVYDTPRVIKVLGEDMITEQRVSINGDPEKDPTTVDITQGKYDVTITTGPSYTTRRVEAREEMMSMVNAMPDTLGVAADLIVEAQDWPGAAKIAKRMRTQLPPGMITEEDMTEEEKGIAQQNAEAAQAQAQLQQMAMQLEMQDKEIEIMLKRARAIEAEARARESLARAQQALANAAKAGNDIEVSRTEAALDTIEKIYPSPAGNGASR
jgi:hypothetical protein